MVMANVDRCPKGRIRRSSDSKPDYYIGKDLDQGLKRKMPQDFGGSQGEECTCAWLPLACERSLSLSRQLLGPTRWTETMSADCISQQWASPLQALTYSSQNELLKAVRVNFGVVRVLSALH